MTESGVPGITVPDEPECHHGCSFGCGNPYEFVVVTVRDSTTQFLCAPDFIQVAAAMAMAITDEDNPLVQEAVSSYDPDVVSGPGKRGRKAAYRADGDSSDGGFAFDEFEPDVTQSA